MVCHRLRIFHAETGEQHFGVAIRNIVAIAIGVEEQVGDLQYIHAAITKFDSSGQVEPIDKVFGLVGATIAIFVGQDRNFVRAARAARRRLGDAVVLRPRPAVDFDALEAGRIRILQILNCPQSSSIIALDEDGLPDERLRGEQLYLDSVHRADMCFDLGWRKALGHYGRDAIR